MVAKTKLGKLVEKRRYMFWGISPSAFDELSLESVVEGILNFGDIEDYYALEEIIGEKKIAESFRSAISKQRSNFFPLIANYYKIYFDRHVPEHSH